MRQESPCIPLSSLTFLAQHPDRPVQGRTLAVELGLAKDENDDTGHQKIAGCWGHVGRYCETWKRAIPFRWNEEYGYWITAATADVLEAAGF